MDLNHRPSPEGAALSLSYNGMSCGTPELNLLYAQLMRLAKIPTYTARDNLNFSFCVIQ